MNKTRWILYSVLVLPLLVAMLYVGSMNSMERGGFFADYRRNLGRLSSGEFEFSELFQSEQARAPRRWQNRHDRGYDLAAVFARLDKNGNRRLERSELGQRLRARIESDNLASWPLNAEQFLQAAYALQAVPPRTSEFDLVVASPASPEQPSLRADDLFDPLRVLSIEIQIDAADWQALCNQSRSHSSAFENPIDKPYTNFRADLRIDGILIRDVAIRKKGFIGSQDTVRPSLKVKFDEFVDQAPIEGLDRLTLNNNKQDHSLQSQFLTYELFRKAGVNAPRCSFAAVTVNGQYLGIYSNVESVRKPMLRASFGNDSGKLYEGTLTDLYPKSIDWFEAKTKEDADRIELRQLSELLYSEDLSVEKVAELVDLDSFLRYWAVESLINFWDGYTQNQNNFFMYANPTDSKFYFMPWGADSCFGGRPGFANWDNNRSSVVRATSILANRLYHLDGIPERYRATLREILSRVWDEQEMLHKSGQIEALLFDHLDAFQLDALVAADQLRDFIRGRRDSIEFELENRWPIPVADEPRLPMYNEHIGSATGSFTAKLTDEGELKGLVDGATFVLEGEPVELHGIKLRRVPEPETGVDPEQPTVSASTIRSVSLIGNLHGRPIGIELVADQDVDAEKPIRLSGYLDDGTYAWGAGKTARGTLQLEPTEPTLADTRSGTFDIQIVEKRGGRMGRRRR